MQSAAASDHRRFASTTPSASDVDIEALAFRGVTARFRLRGVRGAALRRFYDRYLPDKVCPIVGEGDGDEGLDEFDDLVELLRDHRNDESELTEWLACAVSTACFGNNHLWQDMGLPNRAGLSELLRVHFTKLHDKNTGNMKWKKFFYKQICERMQVNVCKAPSCSVCSDYSQCFGPEEDGTAS